MPEGESSKANYQQKTQNNCGNKQLQKARAEGYENGLKLV
jgi:hypothetical protein